MEHLQDMSARSDEPAERPYTTVSVVEIEENARSFFLFPPEIGSGLI